MPVFLLYPSAVEDIGIEEGYQYHQQNDGQEYPKAADEARKHDGKAADHPESAGKAVGPVPVFLAV